MQETLTTAGLPPLLDIHPEPVLALDANECIAAANAAALRFLGKGRAQLAGRDVRDLLSPAARSGLAARPRHAGPPWTADLEFVHASGALLPARIYGASDDAGSFQFVVHEIPAATPPVPALDSAFRFMANNLSEMVLAYDMDRRPVFVNTAAESLTGYSAVEIERAGFINWVHPDDCQRMLAYWEELFKGKSINDEEYRLVTRDGRVKWVSASWGPILDDQGRQVGVQGRERDITGRRMAEEALRQSEQLHRVNEARYHVLFEESPFPMLELDLSSCRHFLDRQQAAKDPHAWLAAHSREAVEALRSVRLADGNRAAREFYRVGTREELVAAFGQLSETALGQIRLEDLAELAATNSFAKPEIRILAAGGEERTVSMIVNVAGSPGDWQRAVVSFLDITDRKRLERELIQSQKMESLGRLAGGIAHDFNNLLMVVLGYSELLLTQAGGNEILTSGLKEIRAAGERGSELTAQLLAFSSKPVTRIESVDLNHLVRESNSMLERVIGEDVRLELSLAPDAGCIRADAGRLRQVLMNLVVNAREAMPAGGTLSISTAASPGERTPGDYVMLEVRDTGIGMDEKARQHVFEPFFAGNSTVRSTSLGLATVFTAVTEARGHISVDSKPGGGSIFRLYFPRDGGDVPKAHSLMSAEKRTARGRVLVVEDQVEVRKVACTILRGMGLEVMDAPSGEAALALASTAAVDVLLTDVVMPGMNGRELASRFTSLHPNTGVIYMSGYTDRVMSPDTSAEPSLLFLQKPFRPEELVRMVMQALPRTEPIG